MKGGDIMVDDDLFNDKSYQEWDLSDSEEDDERLADYIFQDDDEEDYEW